MAVIDAKFKPDYVAAANARRVTNADVYQLLFYQARAAQHAMVPSLPAAIAAPKLHSGGVDPSVTQYIEWRAPNESRRIDLIPVPLSDLLGALATRSPIDAIDVAPQLRKFLRGNWLASTTKRTPI